GTRAYRDALDDSTTNHGWECAAAATTLFIEGTAFERGELDERAPKRPMPPLEQHPLHVHYGLPLEALSLPRVHRFVEGGHRTAAWRTILDHVDEPKRAAVVATLERCLVGWLAYKDAVADAVGV
ncbi:MAG TPA: hypothetical protein VGO62_17745, partial [Myxococcota bacterium]